MSYPEEHNISHILKSLKTNRTLSIQSDDVVLSLENQKADLSVVEYIKTDEQIRNKQTGDCSTQKKRKIVPSVKEFKNLKLRNPPKPFYSTINSLSLEQKKKLSEIGFDSLLQFNCNGVPGKLGYFVVDCFDPFSMKLKLPKGNIAITPNLIQHIFGLPCGGKPINSLTVKDSTSDSSSKWKSQFSNDIRANDIKNKIQESKEDDLLFVLNFILLFLNSIVECVSSGICKIDILEFIDETVDVKSLDWCGYIYESLKNCKRLWKRDDPGCYFAGPIMFLTLLYLECSSFKQLESPDNMPSMKFWNLDMMKKREVLELESGGFGNCEIKTPIEKMVLHEESSTKFNKLLEDIEAKLHYFFDAKVDLDFLISRAIKEFPESQILKQKKDLFYSMFSTGNANLDTTVDHFNQQGVDGLKEIQENFNVEDCFHNVVDVKIFPNDAVDNVLDEILTETLDNTIAYVEENSNINSVREEYVEDHQRAIQEEHSYSQTIMETASQILEDPQVLAYLIASPFNNDQSSYKHEIDDSYPTFSLGLSQDSNSSKDEIQITVNMRSPLRKRQINTQSLIKKEEINISFSIFSTTGEPMDVVFLTNSGKSLLRMELETLIPGLIVHHKVVDIWGYILNDEEKYRSHTSPRRYYFPTTLFDDNITNERQEFKQRFQIFQNRLKLAMKECKHLLSFKDIDLVFIPIFNSDDIYLMVINLNQPSLSLIDNSSDEDLIKYKNVPQIAVDLFSNHLNDVEHKKAKQFCSLKAKTASLRWSTEKNSIDDAVFLMCHMDTYVGEPLEKYNCGLYVECCQVTQLKSLRAKYAAKILLSELNLKKQEMILEAENFAHINTEDKKKYLEFALKNWQTKRNINNA